jgi:hypothetical protein
MKYDGLLKDLGENKVIGAPLCAEPWHTSQSGGWHHLDFQHTDRFILI